MLLCAGDRDERVDLLGKVVSISRLVLIHHNDCHAAAGKIHGAPTRKPYVYAGLTRNEEKPTWFGRC